MMESITKAGRSVSSGVYRVAGAFARGARRVLSYVPLLGVAVAPPELEEVEEAETSSLVRYLFRSLAWIIVDISNASLRLLRIFFYAVRSNNRPRWPCSDRLMGVEIVVLVNSIVSRENELVSREYAIFYLCLSPRRSISFLRDNPLFHGFEHGVVETKVNRNRRSWRGGSSSSLTRNTPIYFIHIYI